MLNVKKLPIDVFPNFYSFWYSKPEEVQSKVLVFNRETKLHEEKTIFRSYMSYLNTPEFDNDIEKSYMFLNRSEKVPMEFEPFIEFAKSIDPNYNQMVVNWYEANDYIEFHRDCTANMLSKDSPILTINLNETRDIYSARSLMMVDVETNEVSSIPLLDKTYFIINNNSTHRHAVGRGTERRISITFRMMVA